MPVVIKETKAPAWTTCSPIEFVQLMARHLNNVLRTGKAYHEGLDSYSASTAEAVLVRWIWRWIAYKQTYPGAVEAALKGKAMLEKIIRK